VGFDVVVDGVEGVDVIASLFGEVRAVFEDLVEELDGRDLGPVDGRGPGR
jgi:hypothetical protein